MPIQPRPPQEPPLLGFGFEACPYPDTASPPPLGTCDMPESGRHQHQGRSTVREVANHPGPSPDLPVHPFQNIVGSDPGPVVSWKSHVGQRLVDSFPQDLSRRPQVHVQQLDGLLALLGLDGLEHRSDFRDLFPGHLGQDVPVEMEDATLPVSIRHALVYRLHQPSHLSLTISRTPERPRETRCRRNSTQLSLSSCMPSQTPTISLYPSAFTLIATRRAILRTSPPQVRFSQTPSRYR